MGQWAYVSGSQGAPPSRLWAAGGPAAAAPVRRSLMRRKESVWQY
jgi:hypothetical protein